MSPGAANGFDAARSDRLLVVEDDEALVHLITRRLTRSGFVIDSAFNATAALEVTSATAFDLLLLDYQLPDMTGRELIQRLQNRGCTSPFIVITGHGDEQIAVEIMKQGARDYLVKDRALLERLPAVIQQTCHQIETERRLQETEYRLQQSERNAQALLDASSEAAMLVDRQGRILATNAILAARLGRPAVDLVGAHVRDLSVASMSATLRQRFEEAIATRAMLRFEHHEDGRSYDTSIHPVIDEAGEVVHVAVYSGDITEQRKLADQLRQAQKMEAVGQLAGGVAHDFNNILQVILGHSLLMEEGQGAEGEMAEGLREIRESARRAATLTRQLLVFSRQQVLRDEAVDVNQVVEGLLKMVHRLIGERIHVEFFAGEGLGAVRGDPGQIEQALLNLCINARDAMPTGGRMTLETRRLEADEDYCAIHEGILPGPYVQLLVSDTGVGMSKAVLDHIFEPFFTTKEIGRGTGLGLATVYGIVKQHKGGIQVYSEVGQGTVFTILLPVAASKRTGVEESVSRVEHRPRGGSETILLAEDEPGVRRLARRTLEIHGYRVLDAANGDEAINLFRQRGDEIALAVLDVVLPGVAGAALRDELLRMRPGLPLLFTTGYSSRMEQVGFIAEMGHSILQKPYVPADLARRVREALDAAASGDTPQPRE